MDLPGTDQNLKALQVVKNRSKDLADPGNFTRPESYRGSVERPEVMNLCTIGLYVQIS